MAEQAIIQIDRRRSMAPREVGVVATEISIKDDTPEWKPTRPMIERDPGHPEYMPSGNSFGIRLMHLKC